MGYFQRVYGERSICIVVPFARSGDRSTYEGATRFPGYGDNTNHRRKAAQNLLKQT